MIMARLRDATLRASLWLIILTQIFYVLPYAETIMFYRIGLAIALLMLAHSLKQQMLTRTECVVLTGLLVVPVTWFTLQAAFFANRQILSTTVVYALFVLSGFALYRYTTLDYICRIIRVFVVINLILIPVWFFAGSIEYYTPTDPRLDGSVVMNWHEIYQKVVVYDEDDGLFPRSAGFTRNPNNLAFLAFIGTVGLTLTKTSRKSLVAWGITLCILFFMTQSRGALLSIGLFILCVSLGHIKSLLKKIALTFSVVAGGSILLFLMNAVRVGGDASSGRTEQWRLALRTVDYTGLKFFFGAGLNQSFEKLSGVLGGLSYGVDSTPITLLIEHGIIGSIILLGCFGATILYAYYTRSNERNIVDARIFIAFFVVWAIYSVFETALYRNTFYQTILTFIILTFANRKTFTDKTPMDAD